MTQCFGYFRAAVQADGQQSGAGRRAIERCRQTGNKAVQMDGLIPQLSQKLRESSCIFQKYELL